MIQLKTPREIKIMESGGSKLARIRDELVRMVNSGITPQSIEQKAQILIARSGGRPSFQMVKNYHWATCVNVNDGVVHGVPDNRPFVEGDIVSLDIGLFYKGFHTDTSVTVPVGQVSRSTLKFLEAGRRALKEAIEKARLGSRVSDISLAIQKGVEGGGYSPIRALTGHGIGRKLHEPPQIPCFWEGRPDTDETFPTGSVLAIEVIYTMGQPDIVISSEDNWTIRTKDGKIAGLFEETVAIGGNGPFVLTGSR